MSAAARRSPGAKSANLMVRLDPPSKGMIVRAARRRGVNTSDYVRAVVVEEARRDVEEARTRTIRLSPADQEAFWRALRAPVRLTPRQRELGRLMRGEA